MLRHLDNPLRKPPELLRTARRGVTLIELLVVIMILSIVTAASIPLLTAGVDQRRVRESARLVSSYISSAKSRAVETGRPSGVMIQRYAPAATSSGNTLTSLPDYAMTLVTVDIPAPYSGDTTSSTAQIDTQLAVVRTISYGGTTYTNISCGTLIGFPYDAGGYLNLVRVGDLIRFGYQGRWYMIVGVANTPPPSVASQTWYTILNPSYTAGTPLSVTPSTTVTAAAAPWILFAVDGSGATPPPTPAGSTGVPYQILRQPTKAAVPPLQLPEGVVIDLENSGVGLTGTFLGGAGNPANGFTSMPWYPNPIITFYPTGLVGFIYSGSNQPQHLTNALYLLVGRRDGMSDVNPNNAGTYHPTLGPGGNPISASNPASDPNNLPNLYDMTNLWVAVSPTSGMVVTAENANMANIITYDTSGGATAAQFVSDMYTTARQFAQSATSMGGK